MRAAHIRDWQEAASRGIITAGDVEAIKTAHEAVAKVIEVDDFAPVALSPFYRQNHPATASA